MSEETVRSGRSFNERIIDEFRANGGRVGGRFEGTPLLLLHHIGAKSGERRVSPLAYQATDGGYAVFASNAGRDSHPAWYHNLLAHPSTSIEVGTEELAVSSRVARVEERASIWDRQKERSPGFARYEAGTPRRIPVVILEPVTHDE